MPGLPAPLQLRKRGVTGLDVYLGDCKIINSR
jgi:hypothetical protein